MSPADSLNASFALSGVLNIVLVLVCIALAWWSLQSFRFDLFLKNPKGAQAKMLLILLSIALGYGVASFFIAYFGWATLLKELF